MINSSERRRHSTAEFRQALLNITHASLEDSCGFF
jgi:hypothetical protein